jgi:hypothetical protein
MLFQEHSRRALAKNPLSFRYSYTTLQLHS